MKDRVKAHANRLDKPKFISKNTNPNHIRLVYEDAAAGKVDLFITKSVSRFARNTVDNLTTIRNPESNGTEVLFEKENTRTFNSKGDCSKADRERQLPTR